MSENTRKVLMGALMAGLGAVATYALDNLTSLAIPAAYLPLVTAGLGAAINAMRKAGWFNFGPTPSPVIPLPIPAPGPTPGPLDDRPILKFLLEVVKDRFAVGDLAGAETAMSLSQRIASEKA